MLSLLQLHLLDPCVCSSGTVILLNPFKCVSIFEVEQLEVVLIVAVEKSVLNLGNGTFFLQFYKFILELHVLTKSDMLLWSLFWLLALNE